MVSLRRSLLIAASLLLMVFVAACGGSPPTSQSSSASVAAKQSAQQTSGQASGAYNDQNNSQINGQNKAQTSSQAYNGQMSSQTDNSQASSQTTNNQTSSHVKTVSHDTKQTGTQANGTTSTSDTNTYVRTTPVTLNGNNVLLLTTGDGMALYYRTSDPAPASACTGTCAQNWPPLTGTGMLISSQSLPASLTFHTTANGNQVEYGGRPLYSYSGDTAPGQINGQGVNGWVPVTITIGPQQKMHW